MQKNTIVKNILNIAKNTRGHNMLNITDLKQALFEQEHEQQQQQYQIEQIKQEREQTKQQLKQAQFELAKAKHEHQKQLQEQKIKLLQAKEQRQQELHEQKLKQALKQQKTDNITYITSITITFLSILASVILFITILIKG